MAIGAFANASRVLANEPGPLQAAFPVEGRPAREYLAGVERSMLLRLLHWKPLRGHAPSCRELHLAMPEQGHALLVDMPCTAIAAVPDHLLECLSLHPSTRCLRCACLGFTNTSPASRTSAAPYVCLVIAALWP